MALMPPTRPGEKRRPPTWKHPWQKHRRRVLAAWPVFQEVVYCPSCRLEVHLPEEQTDGWENLEHSHPCTTVHLLHPDHDPRKEPDYPWHYDQPNFAADPPWAGKAVCGWSRQWDQNSSRPPARISWPIIVGDKAYPDPRVTCPDCLAQANPPVDTEPIFIDNISSLIT